MTTNNKIQGIIDNAQAGDTIQFTGSQYTHIHLSVNKPLNITSKVATQLYACPTQIPSGSDNLAAFSIHDGASGTSISGFKINNNNNGYGIYIGNTSKINVENNTITCNNGTGIKVFNSNQTSILKNLITGSNKNGILLGVNVYNTIIDSNTITSNKYSGINLLESCNNVTITGNSITHNENTDGTGRGIYVNSTINGLNISSNFIYNNGKFGICYDIGVPEMTPTTQTVDYNYINGHNADYYSRDVIYLVPTEEITAPVWIGINSFGGFNHLCPKVQLGGEAVMSKIKQLAPGKYSVSFIDKTTGVLYKEFGSFYITFFLNKNDTNKGGADPGDVWKEVLVQNGTATVDFTKNTYKATNNTIFVIAPYSGFNNAMKDIFQVKNSDIPSTKINLSVSYTVAKKIIKNGDTITYQIKIKNNNSKAATGVKVKNILSTSYFSSSAKAPRGTYSSGVWNIGTLKAGETLTLSVNAKAKKSGTTKSQAQVTGTNVNTLYSTSITKMIHKYVKLSYTNSVSSTKVKQGKYVYLISKVKNSGKDASDPVKVKLTLPGGMKVVSTGYSTVYNKNTKTWTYKVPAGKTAVLKAKVQVTSKGTKKVTFNNNGKKQTKTINIIKDVKLSYVNSVSSTKVKQGKYVYLTSKVKNSGKDSSDPVKVKLTLPGGMKVVSTGYSTVYNKNTKTWTYKVPAGKTAVLKAKVQVTSKGTKKVTFNNNGKKQTKTILVTPKTSRY